MDQLPTATVPMPTPTSTDPIRTGGAWTGHRTFNTAAVQATVAELTAQAEAPTPEQEAAYDEALRIVGDSPERAARALELIAEDQAPACPVHPWCIEKGAHTWHNSETVEVTAECGIGKKHNHSDTPPYLEVRLISEDNPTTGVRGDNAAVMIDDCEVDADGARHEVEKIRAALPRIEALAAQLDGAAALPTSRYMPSPEWGDAEEIRTVGADSAILKAALFVPTDVNGADEPPVLAVYSGGFGTDVELDRAGALNLRAQMLAFLPKLDAMISLLPAEVPTTPPESEKARETESASGQVAQA